MIDGVDRRLEAWVKAVLAEGVEVSFFPPSQNTGETRVHVYLTDVLNRPATGEARIVPHRILLRYLVTVSAEDPTSAHSLLGHLVFAALEQPDFEVEMDALPVEIWSTFGVPPRPSFVLRLPLTHPKPVRPVKQSEPGDLDIALHLLQALQPDAAPPPHLDVRDRCAVRRSH